MFASKFFLKKELSVFLSACNVQRALLTVNFQNDERTTKQCVTKVGTEFQKGKKFKLKLQ